MTLEEFTVVMTEFENVCDDVKDFMDTFSELLKEYQEKRNEK